jgi:hypothetical protein
LIFNCESPELWGNKFLFLKATQIVVFVYSKTPRRSSQLFGQSEGIDMSWMIWSGYQSLHCSTAFCDVSLVRYFKGEKGFFQTSLNSTLTPNNIYNVKQ